MPTEPIDYKQLDELLAKEFPNSFSFLRDRNYAFVSTDWLVNKAQIILRDNRRSGLAFGPRWDCDDFANDLVNQVSKEHARTGGVEAEGVAVGWIMYDSKRVGKHIAIFTVDSDHKILYLEPQTAELFQLTKKEKESVCVFYC